MSALLVLTGLALMPLFAPLGEVPTTASLFLARAAIMGSFQILFVYAPEVCG